MAIATASCRKGVTLPEGDVLAAISGPSADDKPFDSASLRGKPTLVIFASPTCGYCTQELPIAQKVTETEGANVVAIYIAGGKKHAIQAAKNSKFTGTVLFDEGGKLRQQYEIQGVPYTLVLGPDGKARDAFRGLQDEATLRSAIAGAR
jgi:cytochrome c biogenesis protein CcmG, thiol:disulfide interchange protein DsbE